jgi:hypothetical protein
MYLARVIASICIIAAIVETCVADRFLRYLTLPKNMVLGTKSLPTSVVFSTSWQVLGPFQIGTRGITVNLFSISVLTLLQKRHGQQIPWSGTRRLATSRHLPIQLCQALWLPRLVRSGLQSQQTCLPRHRRRQNCESAFPTCSGLCCVFRTAGQALNGRPGLAA